MAFWLNDESCLKSHLCALNVINDLRRPPWDRARIERWWAWWRYRRTCRAPGGWWPASDTPSACWRRLGASVRRSAPASCPPAPRTEIFLQILESRKKCSWVEKYSCNKTKYFRLRWFYKGKLRMLRKRELKETWERPELDLKETWKRP